MPANLVTARQLICQNQLGAAEAELHTILSQDRENMAALCLVAVVFAKTGRMQQAEPLLEAVLQRNPEDVEATSWLAIAKKQRNQIPEAISLFQRAIELGNETAEAYNNLGLCYLSAFDPVAAGAAFKQAITLDRGAAQGYHNLAMALKMGNSTYEAFLLFKRSTELDPDFLGNYIQIWKQMQMLLNWGEGLPILESGLKRMPTSVVLMVSVAGAYGKVGEVAKAEALFKKATTKIPTAGTQYARWLQQEGRFEDSVGVLKESL